MIGFGTGDIECAAFNGCLYVWNSLESLPANQLDSFIQSLFDRMLFLRQDKSLLIIKPCWQMLKNFLGQSTNPKEICGEVLGEEEYEEIRKEHWRFKAAAMYSITLAYHFSDFERAESFIKFGGGFYKGLNTIGRAYFRMYHALTHLALAKKGDWKRLRRVRRHLKVLRKWSKLCPENFLGKQALVEAELAAVLNQTSKARFKYYLAIIQSYHAGLLMQEALANERAGKFYASIGDHAEAKQLLEEACRLYKAWGGVAKVAHLEMEMRYLLVE